MTCVMAWTDQKRMIMASDSAVTQEDHLLTMKEPKFHLVSQKGNPEMLIGYAGRAKAGQILLDLHAVKLPQDTTPDPYIFITQTLVPIVQEILSQYRLGFEVETGEFCHENMFIVAYRGHLYTINQDFYVCETIDEFAAIGSGEDYALGAMNALKNICPTITPESLVIEGMNAAIKYSSSVRGPIKMVEIDATKIIQLTKSNNKPKPKKNVRKTKKKPGNKGKK